MFHRTGTVAVAILIATTFTIAPSGSAAGAPEGFTRGPEEPLTFDVWVDGRYSERLVLTGVPYRGSILLDGVYIEIVPIFTYYLALQVEATVTLLFGGEHTVGIGYSGHNVGTRLSGLPGATIVLDIIWDVNLVSYGLGYVPCSVTSHLTIRNLDASRVDQLLMSVGRTFSEEDPTFARMATSLPLLGSHRFDFQIVEGNGASCPRYALELTVPSAMLDVFIRFEKWHGTIPHLPSGTLRAVENYFNPKWTGGYEISYTAPVTGVFTGEVEKFGVRVPLTVVLKGARTIQFWWSGSNPWLRLGVALHDPGNYAHVQAFGLFDIRAEKLSSTTTLFRNDGGLDRFITKGTCQVAIGGAVEECTLAV